MSRTATFVSRRATWYGAILATAATVLLMCASSAMAFSFKTFAAESSSLVAGAHADLTTKFRMSGETVGEPGPFEKVRPEGVLRDVDVALPPGIVGDPSAVPQCSQAGFSQRACAADTQVGVVAVGNLGGWGGTSGGSPTGFLLMFTPLPVFNLVPRDEEVTGEMGFSVGGTIFVHLPISVRTDDDYGLTVESPGIFAANPVLSVDLTTWGVPGDPIHDPLRVNVDAEPIARPPGLQETPFLTNPTNCNGSRQFLAAADSYEAPETKVTATASVPQVTDCDSVEFRPTLKARPTTNVADAPSGLDVDLALAQNEDPHDRATSALRDAVVTLPEGLVVNPSSANGLEACSPAQVGLTSAVGDAQAHFNRSKPSCPGASSVGTVEVEVPAFDDPLKGTVYLASPHQNPFGSLLSLYLVAEGHGLMIKLAGKVETDPKTGQITTVFEENPQQPVEHLRMSLFSGSGAPLRTPANCGTYSTTSVLTPWSAPESGPPATPSDTYAISRGSDGGACSAPANSPSFEAGTASAIAGANSPFVINLNRPDGSQELSSLTVKPPAGLLARLAGVPYCPEAALAAAAARSGREEQASPSCPAASQVGTVSVAAGAGPKPFNAPGNVYLAGPYRGAPLSLAVVTPAVAGPFDLGTVVVRNALFVNPETAEVTAVSDPIPSILEGIPLDIRQIQLRLDRPNFTVNPTSCDPTAVTGSALSLLNQSAPLLSRFQVGECGRLKFGPKLRISLKGPVKRTGNPALKAILTAPAGQANIANTTVLLPKSEYIDNAHISNPCTRVQFNAGACPKKSILGTARAFSPLLDKPLEGPVYFRSNGGERDLPDIVADLNGQIHVTLVGFIDTVKVGKEGARVRTTFANVPDAPVSRFELSLYGGKRGLLENSVNLCGKEFGKAGVQMTGHNGKTADSQLTIDTSCGGKKGKKRGGK
jgi:hypothetical protein